MPEIIVGGVCRYTVHGRVLGHTWANIIDMHIDTLFGGVRDVNVVDQGNIILEEYGDAWATQLSSSWFLDSVSWVDLDSASGTTGSTTVGSEGTVSPRAGGIAGEGANPGSAALTIKQTASQRGRHRGRMYVAGLTESQVAGDSIVAGSLTALQTAANAFLSAINQSGHTPVLPGGGAYNSELVVVHAPPGEPASYSKVNALQVQALLATQRRRLRR